MTVIFVSGHGCKHKFQDALYGGKRVANQMKIKDNNIKVRCTVCGLEITINQPKREIKEKEGEGEK